jgi:gamma-glutamylcyclotransferase (GGCT)/AIG2-like uncharacterized protein YtfP
MNVFTYGSLMFPTVWTRVVRGAYRSTQASVNGFRRVAVRNHEHPALIICASAAHVTGRIYYDVSAEDAARLDHFETRNYARVAIAVTVPEQVVVAQSYLALNIESLLAEDWSAAAFEQHGLAIFNATYVVANAPSD